METAQKRLARDAIALKKAWMFACVWTERVSKVPPAYLHVPDYASWSKKALMPEVEALRKDTRDVLRKIVRNRDRRNLDRLAKWMGEQFDHWVTEGGGIHRVCLAQDFEDQFGELLARDGLEVPPYAEMLVQGSYGGLAIRHPEYMLARDLLFTYSLFRDADELLKQADWRRPPDWAAFGGENVITLGRLTILCCFNLLESFVSGLARAHVMLTPSLPESEVKKLLDSDSELLSRMIGIPRRITGQQPLGLNRDKPPLKRLFKTFKKHRDAFVHCEPGPQESSRGYVKEEAFHDVTRENVDEAIELTEEVIRLIWKHVHRMDGPRWLPKIRESAASGSRLQLSVPPT